VLFLSNVLCRTLINTPFTTRRSSDLVMLPDMSGIEVCKYIRQNFDQVGIIMLTAKAQEDDKIEGFISGADDYMVKPFRIKELLRSKEHRLNSSHVSISYEVFCLKKKI